MELEMFSKITGERAVDEILDQIIEKIRNGTLKKGDALPSERTMAQLLGVSRPLVREALRSLEFMGVVTSVRGGANYISEDLDNCLIRPLSTLFRLKISSARQTQQLRAALERETACLAAENCSEVEAAELQLILAKLDASDDEKMRANLDRDLHIRIGQIAGNPMIFSVISASNQLIENMITGIRAHIMKKKNSSADVDEQHRRLVAAIVSHQPEEARACMEEHMKSIAAYIEEMEAERSKS